MADTPLLRVRGQFFAPDGRTPSSGTLELTLTAPLPVLGDRTYEPTLISAPLDDTGHVHATGGTDLYVVPSDPAGSPYALPGVSYRITARFAGERSRTWETYLSRTSPLVDGIPTIDLNDIVAASHRPPVFDYATQTALNAEAARAAQAELDLADSIATEAETAETAEETLNAALAAEAARAAQAELDAIAAAEAYAAALVAALPAVTGVPNVATASAIDLDTGDPYLDPVAIPDDDSALVVTDLGEILLVTRTETALATVDQTEQGDAATLASAEDYTDLELALHVAAADPHPQYALDSDLATLVTLDDVLAYSLIFGGS